MNPEVFNPEFLQNQAGGEYHGKRKGSRCYSQWGVVGGVDCFADLWDDPLSVLWKKGKGNMFAQILTGTAPILLTVPHDGGQRVPGAAVRRRSAGRDIGTLPLALRCYDKLLDIGIRPTLIWQTLHRSHADVNRGPECAEPYAEGFREAYDEFHGTVDLQASRILDRYGKVVHLDIHGTALPEGIDCVLGTNGHRTSPRGTDTAFAEKLCQWYAVDISPGGRHDFDGRFSGGWVVRRSAERWGAYGLDAIQIEIDRRLRVPEYTDDLAGHLAEALAHVT